MKVSQAIKNSFKKRDGLTFSFFIDKSFPAFEGHFPENPVLPAIAQIEIALFCIREIVGKKVSVSEIKKAKFMKPILPDTEIQVVSIEGGGEDFHITVKSANDTHSQIHMKAVEGKI